MRLLAALPAMLLAACGSLYRREAADPSETARRLFSAERVVIEVDYARGCRPEPDALREVRRTLEREGLAVELVLDQEMSEVGPEEQVSRESLDRLETKYRTHPGPGYLHVIVVPWFRDRLDGKGSRGFCAPPMIGIAREKLRAYAFLHITVAKIERLVLTHEIGHAIGAVAGGGHCGNPCCVMYSEPDLLGVLLNLLPALLGLLPDQFCSECRRDLREVRGAAGRR